MPVMSGLFPGIHAVTLRVSSELKPSRLPGPGVYFEPSARTAAWIAGRKSPAMTSNPEQWLAFVANAFDGHGATAPNLQPQREPKSAT
jgi:hypothetical protein